MKRALVLALLATLPAGIAGAQELGGRTVSVDLGLGVTAKPSYPGADDSKAGAWLIWRNFSMSDGAGTGNRQGFAFSPSFSMQAAREASDDASLTGMTDIDRAYELGGKVSYGFGDLTAYGSVRRGFDGHEGLTGEVGAKYRTDLSDRMTLWSGIELGYGNGEYNGTYFGVPLPRRHRVARPIPPAVASIRPRSPSRRAMR